MIVHPGGELGDTSGLQSGTVGSVTHAFGRGRLKCAGRKEMKEGRKERRGTERRTEERKQKKERKEGRKEERERGLEHP